MAVKRRPQAGAQSTSSSGEATPTSAGMTLDDRKLWNPENELKLLEALISYKPAGILKHFQMALIINKLHEGKSKDRKAFEL